MRLLQEFKPLIIIAAALLIVLCLWAIPMLIHHGTVISKERIPQVVSRSRDGVVRTVPEAYYITIESWSGDQVTFRCSEDQFIKNIVGEKYSS